MYFAQENEDKYRFAGKMIGIYYLGMQYLISVFFMLEAMKPIIPSCKALLDMNFT